MSSGSSALPATTTAASAEATLAELKDVISKLAGSIAAASNELTVFASTRADLVTSSNDADGTMTEAGRHLERLEECEFQMRVYLKRAEHAVKTASALENVVGAQHAAFAKRVSTVESERDQLAQQVHQAQMHQKPASSGIASIVAVYASNPSAAVANALPPPRTRGVAPMVPSSFLDGADDHHHRDDGSTCQDCVASSSSSAANRGQPCKHKQILASHVIDHAFDDHRALLRQRLLAAEEKVRQLENGDALRDARRENQRLRDEMRAVQRAGDAERAKWLTMLTASSRLGASVATASSCVAGSSSSTTTTAVRSVMMGVDPLFVIASHNHLLLLSAFREAQSDMKAFLMADAMCAAAAAAAPSPTGAQRSVKVPSPPLEASGGTTERHMSERPSAGPGRRLMHCKDMSAAATSQPESMSMAAQRTAVAPTSAASGSSISRKPLHARGP